MAMTIGQMFGIALVLLMLVSMSHHRPEYFLLHHITLSPGKLFLGPMA